MNPLIYVINMAQTEFGLVILRGGKNLAAGNKAEDYFALPEEAGPFNPLPNFSFVPGKESVQVADSVIHDLKEIVRCLSPLKAKACEELAGKESSDGGNNRLAWGKGVRTKVKTQLLAIPRSCKLPSPTLFPDLKNDAVLIGNDFTGFTHKAKPAHLPRSSNVRVVKYF